MHTSFRIAAVLLVGLVLAGCPQPVGPGDDAGTMPCAGQVGCACQAGNTCQVGECIAGACVDCRRGEAACICRANGTCNPGLRCANAACEACPAGAQGCACGTGDTCNTGLTCTTGTCTPSTCTPGVASCPCRTGTPQCETSAYCDPSSVCQACSADILGCACGPGNVCTGGLTCDATTVTCRTPKTCANRRAAGECVPNQACTESVGGADAVCVPSTCVADFTWDSRTNTCAACVSAGCLSEPTCAAGDAGIGDTCAQQNRVCGQSMSIAFCGSCLPGYREDASQRCVLAAVCGTGTTAVICAASEYCDTVNGTPTCTPSPCGPRQAKESTTACSACPANLMCDTEGFNTRIWPFRNLSGNCVCETRPDYFIPAGMSGLAQKCDADDDGWVNALADNITDPALRANSRCAIRQVDTVKLVDELGTALSLRSCAAEGMISALPDGGQCASVLPLPLLESGRNDSPNYTVGPRVPLYGFTGADGGAVGRFFQANELNALTKACVSELGDFNEDGDDDLLEVAPLLSATSNAATRLEAFAFFTELYTSYYEAPASGPHGKLVIRERSRCDADFPFHYDPAVTSQPPGDLYRADAGATYWRNCDRRRDATYDQSNPRPNYDFAQWDCAAPGGSCPYTQPAHATSVTPVDPTTGLLRNFGLCELNGSPPADGRWRGMNHHSQFKCVKVTTATLADFSATGSLVLNQCAARPCSNPLDPACNSAGGVGPQTRRPLLDCAAVVPGVVPGVGFAAVRYQPYGPSSAGYLTSSYARGCVSEDQETQMIFGTFQTWLCPYPEYTSVFASDSMVGAAQGRKSDAAFGRYSCHGDLQNFLWAPAFVTRATLNWAVDVNDTANGFIRGP